VTATAGPAEAGTAGAVVPLPACVSREATQPPGGLLWGEGDGEGGEGSSEEGEGENLTRLRG